MEDNISKCPRCGRMEYIIPSNNPLIESICIKCLEESMDFNNLEHLAIFCRTYNYSYKPEIWINNCLSTSNPIKTYLNLLNADEIDYNEPTADVWKKVQQEWSKINTFAQLLEKVKPIKEGFMKRAMTKWGGEFTFDELLRLEDLYINTVKAFNITNPIDMDAVKKACRISILIDQQLQSGEAKSIKDFIAAYQNMLKIAKIDDLAETATKGTIKTVADLMAYMEDHNYEFEFYDNVDRDIVDKTIRDIKQSIRDEIVNATGLEVTLQEMKEKYENSLEETKEQEAIEEVPLETLLDKDYYSEQEMEVDKELGEIGVFYDDDDY